MTDPDPPYAAALRERVTQVLAQQAELRAAVEQTRAARSLTFADDEHDPDGSTASLDQARDVALLERAERALGELWAAQQRLADGTYGRCARCGEAIPGPRLLVRPEARRCVPCSAGTVSGA